MAEIISAHAIAQRAAKSKKEKDKLKAELMREQIAATKRQGRKKPYVPGKTAERMEKTKLYTDILESIVAGEQRGRFAATTPEIRHFSISDEPQKAKGPGERYEGSPADWQYIDPKHLDKLRKMGSPIKSITIEGGGGLSPTEKKAEAYNVLLHGGAEQGDPNEIGMLRGPPMSTQQAQQLMATGGTAPSGPPQMAGGPPQMAGGPPQMAAQGRPGPEGRQPSPQYSGLMPMGAPPTTGTGGGGDLRGLMGQINQQGVGGTDLTQLFQGEEYVGKPKKATSPQAIYQLAQQEGILPKKKDAKYITVYQINPEDPGPDSLRVIDTLGPPPEGYTHKSGSGSMTGLPEGTKKLKSYLGGQPQGPAPETPETVARSYWTVAQQELAQRGIKDPSPMQIRALAEELARNDGR